jgi:hypothetical protein
METIMVTRRVGVGEVEQIIHTTFTTDINGDITENVTLSTPRDPSDSQKLRVLTSKDFGREWMK